MDYSQTYNFIVSTGGVTNIEENYILYYDETNNPRSFKLTDDGFNVSEYEFFILGGIGFEPDKPALVDDVDELYSNLSLQGSTNEVKFKHICQGAKDFLSLLLKPRVMTLIEWIHEKQYFIHYSYIDNFYYTIVDIVDSMEETWIDPGLNRELKNRLYSLIKEEQDWFVRLLIEVDYPNIKNHREFVEKIIDWIWTQNFEDDFYLEYLRQSLKSYRNKQLVFLENNEDRIAIGDYSPFYANLIVTYPNAKHILDQEFRIEEKFLKNPIELSGHKGIDYKFINSEHERLIQISDLTVGVLRYWMTFLESVNIYELNEILNEASDLQKVQLRKFQKILLHSLNVSTGFKHGIGSNEFEIKIKFFLEYGF